MRIGPRETTGRQLSAPASTAAGGDADRLNEDEWQFLRATPDYDAEEMAGATSDVGYRISDFGNLTTDDSLLSEIRFPMSDIQVPEAGFPEADTLVAMLGELMEAPRAAGAASAEDTAWQGVPPAGEWAELMEPQGGAAEHGNALAAAPPASLSRDVLLDALAAGERIGLLPHSAPQGH